VLADEGFYVASESSFHRILRAAGPSSHRGRAKPPEIKTADDSYRHSSQLGVVLVYDLFADDCHRMRVPPLPYPRSLQQKNCGIGGTPTTTPTTSRQAHCIS
jgi:hypothetical protein